MKNDWRLFDENTQAVVYGMQPNPIQRMLDFDFVSGRKKPSVACIVNPGSHGILAHFFGKDQILVPVYPDIASACKKHADASVFINFASYRSAHKASMHAMEQDSIRVIVVIAEGVPENQTRELIALAKRKGRVIIGPSTVGGLAAGRFRIGNTGGTIENIAESKLFRPGSVGLVSKSGGMLNELFNIVARNADGVNEGISIGGDTFPGSDFLDHLLRFEENPEIKMLVMLGELGAGDEIEVAKAAKDGRIKKPLVAWVSGTVAKLFQSEVQFGHAGAKSGEETTSAQAKNRALKEAGAIVPQSFDSLGDEIGAVYKRLVSKGVIKLKKESPIPRLPMDYKAAAATGVVRREAQFISTISDDRGEDVEYLGKPLGELLKEGAGIGDVIGRLWFKKELPKSASQFIELVLIAVADHGPAVSGAHNAIVAARAGKDIISSLASGLLTIGPRFGGAIDDAARVFRRAKDSGMGPQEFVEHMKEQGKYIPGIGHRVKSLKNPDRRVELLKEYARKHFRETEYLDYALEVEKLTAAKKANLILNVDGIIGVLFLDLMKSCKEFTEEEIEEIVSIGCLNGLFALGRSIGIMGHIIDQYRLKTHLYRVPEDDILYVKGS